ncbi:hypothetical protein E1262_27210 [Jiangella aurantiaca]|uniref:Uncharacterized protein n=1 Tax=Jiangella aurantiaca TaxID=2530373 RepID=A0A4R5A1H5_9ACTN|nr:hypothetical protein [Jiangella aurantiaca]TDD64780.1 hypothetical protein E1262_27210 [Jiangella aurantiaca]
MNTVSPTPSCNGGCSSPRTVVIISQSTLAGTAGHYLITDSIPAGIIGAVASLIVVAMMTAHSKLHRLK